jgi:dTDP-glucose 4,6-dehydratase
MRSEQQDSTVLVTGGAGFLGAHVCRWLVESDYRVVCVDNLSSALPGSLHDLVGHPLFTFVDVDVCELEQESLSADFILHLASPASPVDYLSNQVDTLRTGSIGTLKVLELAQRVGARLVFASTSEVYGDPAQHPQPESYWGNVNPVGPRAVYDEQKRFGEAATSAFRRERGVDAGIVRIFNTYGPGMRADDGRLIPSLVTKALLDQPMPVYGDGSQTRSLCYIDDLVDGLLRMMISDLPGPINLGNSEELSVLEIAEAVRAATGSRSEITFLPPREDDPGRRCPELKSADLLLDWRPTTSLSEGLDTTVAWFKDYLN